MHSRWMCVAISRMRSPGSTLASCSPCRCHVPCPALAGPSMSYDRSGHYRVIYALIRRGAVHVLHAFKKTTQTTPRRHIDLARKRLKEMTQ
jgi:hypothetical protein